MVVASVGVGVLVVRDDKLLMQRRRGAHGEGTWSVPGGHVDFGETLEECAVREAAEETGVSIVEVRFLAITNDVFLKEHRHYVTVWMEGKYAGGEPQRSDEVSDVAWFSLKMLPDPLFLPMENLLGGRCYTDGTARDRLAALFDIKA